MIAVIDSSKKLSLEEFLTLPETKPYSEYFNGEIQAKPMPQGKHSIIQIELGTAINQVGKPNKIALALPELRCTFPGGSIVPDLSVFLWPRLLRDERGRIANQFNIPPDWLIEILSPEQSTTKVIKKILFAIKKGTQLGWIIDPDDESVMIFKPDQFPEIKSEDEDLPVLEALENWQLKVSDLWAWLTV
jgi:Uma2 family endonuclease